MDSLTKQTWISRVRATADFHKEQLRQNPNHTYRDTALLLKRSYGRISEDITLAEWLKTHAKQLERCKSIKEALEFVRMKKMEMRLR